MNRAKHNHYRRTHGHYARVDATPVRRHLNYLAARDLPVNAIAQAAGCSATFVHKILDGTYPTLKRDTARTLWSVDLRPVSGQTTVPAIGLQRRIRALAVQGWPLEYLAARMATSPSYLARLVHHAHTVRYTKWADVAELYVELADHGGGCYRTRSIAQRRGWCSSRHWTDEAIDDPDAAPLPRALPLIRDLPKGA